MKNLITRFLRAACVALTLSLVAYAIALLVDMLLRNDTGASGIASLFAFIGLMFASTAPAVAAVALTDSLD